MLIEFYKYNVCKQNYEEIDSRKVLIVGLLCAMETFSIWQTGELFIYLCSDFAVDMDA